MNGSQFKELIETVCMTYKIPKRKLCIHLGISQPWLNQYERDGVPAQVKPLIISRLRKFYLDKMYVM